MKVDPEKRRHACAATHVLRDAWIGSVRLLRIGPTGGQFKGLWSAPRSAPAGIPLRSATGGRVRVSVLETCERRFGPGAVPPLMIFSSPVELDLNGFDARAELEIEAGDVVHFEIQPSTMAPIRATPNND